MLQKHTDFFFSQPSLYFGEFQELHAPCYEVNESNLLFPLILDISYKPADKQATGLFLHWFD